MIRSRTKRGFTLIELMIVVAIIGILAAIAIPNFIKFQARSKQGEAKSNLRALFTAQRAFFQEKDRYSDSVAEIGFSPERGNRYIYRNGDCAAQDVRSGPGGVVPSTASCITVDTYKFTTATASPVVKHGSAYTWAAEGGADPAAAAEGTVGTCPACNFKGTAGGNVDNEGVGFDSWIISSKDATVTADCGNTDTAAPAGSPFNTYNDVNCDS